MRFLDVRTDFAFKKVFGSEDSKVRLISFLNSVIEFENNAQIKDLVIVDPYNIPLLKGMKDTFVDVKAVLDNGTKVIIEMQVLNHTGLEKRVLYNAAKNYSTQLLEGEKYHLLNPIIALTILDFTMFEDSDKVISNFKLLEKRDFINYTDDLEMIFIELPKFNKSLEELVDIKDQWIYFIKNAGSLEFIPDNMSEPVNSAFAVSNTAGLSAQELEIQYKKKEFIAVQKSIFEADELKTKELMAAREEAQIAKQEAQIAKEEAQIAKEKAQIARAEGRHEGMQEVAKKLLSSGMDESAVAAATNLSLEQVKSL
ncbi:MAG: hypothetical protein QG673_1816 [Pseudomonadota bacterium]|nr:hypothetical protein [Pseudomonadota bacterium]